MSTNVRTLRPVLRIGQRTDPSREFTLSEPDGQAGPIDLTNAERVTMTMEHHELAFTAVSDGECTILDPQEGVVEYDFSTAETSLYGRYYVQFEIEWDDDSRSLIPPEGYDWVLDVMRRQPDHSPLEVPRVYADEGVFGDLEAEQASVRSLAGLETPTGEYVTDLYGQNLYYENGTLNAFDPSGTGEVFDHRHTDTSGDGGAIGTEASPAAPAYFESVTAGSVDSPSVEAGELNTNRVYDSSGRAHGELTGTADAQVVIDAITDRPAGASVIIPDPGFILEWEQQVDLPVEDNFGLETLGMPAIRPATGFTGTAALYKASGQARDLHLGPLYIRDNNGVLTEAIHLKDVRGATIDRTKVWNAPGIRIVGEDIYANQNALYQCETRLPDTANANRNPGPGIVLDSGTLGNTADQNWIFAPHYNATADHTGEIAYIDRGKHNSWLHTRFEFGATIHQMAGGSNYYVSEGGWDRPSEYSVREVGGTSGNPPGGTIENVFGDNFERLRILHPNTRVTSSGDIDSGSRPRLSVVDLLEDLKRLTSARTLASCGLQDDSSGGSVEIGPTWFYKPFLEFQTNAATGNTAVMSTGPYSMSATAMPKAAYSWGPRTTDTTNLIARTGLYGGSGDRFELVFDPQDALGGHASSNWYLEVAQNGIDLGSIDTGVAPHSENDLALNVANLDSGARFCGSVDYTDVDIEGEVTGFQSQMEWRWSLETLADESMNWRLRDDRGMRFLKF